MHSMGEGEQHYGLLTVEGEVGWDQDTSLKNLQEEGKGEQLPSDTSCSQDQNSSCLSQHIKSTQKLHHEAAACNQSEVRL